MGKKYPKPGEKALPGPLVKPGSLRPRRPTVKKIPRLLTDGSRRIRRQQAKSQVLSQQGLTLDGPQVIQGDTIGLARTTVRFLKFGHLIYGGLPNVMAYGQPRPTG